MNVTYYGHACFEVIVAGKKLLFDPFIKENPLAKHIDVDAIQADYIMISHGHSDHIADAIEIAKRCDATVVSNFEIVTWLMSKGVKKGQPMNVGGNWKFDFGKVKFFNAIHSSVLPDGSNGGSAGGFLVESAEGNFYFAGDTGLTYDMKLIGEYKSLDFAMLPLGDNFTMGVDNAIIASDFIRCDRLIGMHFNTFPYIEIDTKVAIEKFKRAGKELLLPQIGETLDLKIKIKS
jgi:L-ascorbate metabolism protein UlaG (beta-lactamase superfamily)